VKTGFAIVDDDKLVDGDQEYVDPAGAVGAPPKVKLEPAQISCPVPVLTASVPTVTTTASVLTQGPLVTVTE
jgi:hypothetical protein